MTKSRIVGCPIGATPWISPTLRQAKSCGGVTPGQRRSPRIQLRSSRSILMSRQPDRVTSYIHRSVGRVHTIDSMSDRRGWRSLACRRVRSPVHRSLLCLATGTFHRKRGEASSARRGCLPSNRPLNAWEYQSFVGRLVAERRVRFHKVGQFVRFDPGRRRCPC